MLLYSLCCILSFFSSLKDNHSRIDPLIGYPVIFPEKFPVLFVPEFFSDFPFLCSSSSSSFQVFFLKNSSCSSCFEIGDAKYSSSSFSFFPFFKFEFELFRKNLNFLDSKQACFCFSILSVVFFLSFFL